MVAPRVAFRARRPAVPSRDDRSEDRADEGLRHGDAHAARGRVDGARSYREQAREVERIVAGRRRDATDREARRVHERRVRTRAPVEAVTDAILIGVNELTVCSAASISAVTVAVVTALVHLEDAVAADRRRSRGCQQRTAWRAAYRARRS